MASLVQLVEIPGLIGGATEDRGGGRALLGVLRTVDAIVYCARAGADPVELETVMAEVTAAGIEKPGGPGGHARRRGRARCGRMRSRRRSRASSSWPVSILDETSLEAFRAAVWGLTGLIRIRLHDGGSVDPEPVAMEPGSTVTDVADWVHHDLAAAFSGARVWGPSARFEGQRVGRDHQVLDGDVVEILR